MLILFIVFLIVGPFSKTFSRFFKSLLMNTNLVLWPSLRKMSTAYDNFSDSISDYDLKKEIGVGSFGRVYEALCVTNGKFCAVKVIDVSLTRRSNINRVNTEVSLHMRLHHENVVKLYNVFQEKNCVYLVLELCWGSLSDYLNLKIERASASKQLSEEPSLVQRPSLVRRNGVVVFQSNTVPKSSPDCPVLTFVVIRRIISQICHGLLYLHKNNIVHRDLNLKNILLKVNPEDKVENIFVKIADFGLAFDTTQNKKKVHAGLFKYSKGTTICGTPGYISPEVWSQSGVAPSTDAYSLGSIVYALCTGVVPKGQVSLSDLKPMIADLIARLMQIDPKKRITIDQVLSHPFIVGHLSTARLGPICKLTKSLELIITDIGIVKIIFLKHSSSIEVDGNKNKIIVESKNGIRHEFQLENLPHHHWKKFLYAWRFVDLVKAKTPKVVIHFSTTEEMADEKGYSVRILKASLMESRHFEAVVQIDTATKTIILQTSNCLEEHLQTKLNQIYVSTLEIERTLESTERKFGIKCFPVTFGRKVRRNTDSTVDHSMSMEGVGSQMSRMVGDSVSENRSLCHNVDGIGSVTLLPNGIFQIDFLDGTCITTGVNAPIIFKDQRGSKSSFTPRDSLPKTILEKMALIPLAINEIRKRSQNF